MESVYLLITDLHYKESGFRGRYDYSKETELVTKNIFNIIEKYNLLGMQVKIIFMGDIFHDSFDEVFESIGQNNNLILMRMLVDEMYSVVGNHELTYYKDNPFWTLFTKIESNNIKTLRNKIWQPRGTMDVLKVVDEIVDGNVRFIINHYGCGVTPARKDGKINIGLFHQDLYAKEIVHDMKYNMGIDMFEHNPVYFTKNNVLRGYDYCFFSHMHMLYGKYEYLLEDTKDIIYLYYLASLGRTNHLEVNDKFLERNIPAVIIKNGKLVKVEDNLFNLPTREESVNEEVIERSKKLRENYKEKVESRIYTNISDDPIENLKASFSDRALMRKMLEEIIDRGYSQYEVELNKLMEDIKWN